MFELSSSSTQNSALYNKLLRVTAIILFVDPKLYKL